VIQQAASYDLLEFMPIAAREWFSVWVGGHGSGWASCAIRH
jgi:hypothetical protein